MNIALSQEEIISKRLIDISMELVGEEEYFHLREINPEITEFRKKGKKKLRINSYEKAEITSRHIFKSEKDILDMIGNLKEFQGIQYLSAQQIPVFLYNPNTLNTTYLERKKLNDLHYKKNLSQNTKTPGSYLEFIFTEDLSEITLRHKLKESLVFKRTLDSSLLLTQVKFSIKNLHHITSSLEIQNSDYNYLNAIYGKNN